MKTLKTITSNEQYLYYLKRLDKKDKFRTELFKIAIYDKLENHGMNNLVKKIHALKKNKKYRVQIYYKKPGAIDIDLISRNLDGQSTFSIAEIIFNEDKWIKRIEIAGTYITSSDVLIEYTFYMKINISSYRIIHDFVMEHNIHYTKYDFYAIYYHFDGFCLSDCVKQEGEILFDIFQDLICELFFSDYGSKYPLPMEVYCHIYKYNRKKEQMIKNSFLTAVYKKENEFLLIPYYKGRFYATIYFYGREYSHNTLFRYFSEYSIEMYYKTFWKIEMAELETRMRKYLNSRKKSVSAKDIKWMINKLRGIEEKENIIKNKLNQNKEDDKKWRKQENGKWIKQDLIFDNSCSLSFKDLYKRNLEYLQAISSTRDNKIVYIISIVSLGVAFIGLIISIWQGFRPNEPTKITNEKNYYYNDNREVNEYKFSIFD